MFEFLPYVLGLKTGFRSRKKSEKLKDSSRSKKKRKLWNRSQESESNKIKTQSCVWSRSWKNFNNDVGVGKNEFIPVAPISSWKKNIVGESSITYSLLTPLHPPHPFTSPFSKKTGRIENTRTLAPIHSTYIP